MLVKLALLCLSLTLLNYVAYPQTSEKVSILVADQSGDLIAVGVVWLIDSKGNKIAEVDLGKTKKTPIINVGTGTYTLEIQSPGFKNYSQEIEVEKGANNIEVKLELAEINVNITVEQSEQEKRLDEAMGGFLSQKEIDRLPETGEEIKEELQKRYGDDILIRVDGDFGGSQIPSRSEIASIKVIRNTFDAEFHEVGYTIIDIRTVAVISAFRGTAFLSFNNSSLNARNPFALKRQPTSSRNLLLFFSGPLIRGKNSFSLSTHRTNRVTTQNFLAKGFTGNVEPQQTENGFAFTTLSIRHSLPKNHVLSFSIQNNAFEYKNSGIGAFDLPERVADSSSVQNKFTVAESGVFKGKYLNDFRFDFSVSRNKTVPKSLERTILVLNAFNTGGSGVNSRTDRKRISLTNTLLFDTKKHSLKFGTEIDYQQIHNVSENNLNGTFTFLNLTDFIDQTPAQFSQTLGTTEYSLSQLRTAFYFQDYLKLNKTFQLSLGLRHEWQNDLGDKNKFSPRLGYVWSPGKSGKFILRGGTGVFYSWLETTTLASILSNDGRQGQRLIIRNPGFPNPFNGSSITQTLPPGISKLPDNLQTPSIFIAQNSFNYKPIKPLYFEGIYTFRRGVHHFRSRNINAPVNGVRPDPGYGIFQLLESSGTLRENSFELKVNGNYKGVNMFGNYKLSDITDDFSDPLSLPMDNYNLRLERGTSSLNQPHTFSVGFDFDLLKTINVSPSFRLESGLPYTITTGRDDNSDTVFNDRPTGIGRNTKYGEWLKQVDVRIRWKVPVQRLEVANKLRSLNLNINVKNLLNTTNLTNYVGVQTSPFFGKATSARNARSIDFGISFGF